MEPQIDQKLVFEVETFIPKLGTSDVHVLTNYLRWYQNAHKTKQWNNFRTYETWLRKAVHFARMGQDIAESIIKGIKNDS